MKTVPDGHWPHRFGDTGDLPEAALQLVLDLLTMTGGVAWLAVLVITLAAGALLSRADR